MPKNAKKKPPYETVIDTRVTRLYRYQPFVEQHLESTLNGALRFSNPQAFNDPWDCKPWFYVPDDHAERVRLIQWFDRVARKSDPHPDEELRARQIDELQRNPEELRSIMAQTSEAIYADLGRRFRLCCFTTKPACPLMWAHYGDRHRGICLEFDAWREDLRSAIKVQYRESYPLFLLDDGNDISPFYTKSADWRYEDEYRLISEEEGTAFHKETLKTCDGFYQLPRNALMSVIIGALAPAEVRARIAGMVARIAPHLIVRQATCLSDRYRLAIEPPIPPNDDFGDSTLV